MSISSSVPAIPDLAATFAYAITEVGADPDTLVSATPLTAPPRYGDHHPAEAARRLPFRALRMGYSATGPLGHPLVAGGRADRACPRPGALPRQLQLGQRGCAGWGTERVHARDRVGARRHLGHAHPDPRRARLGSRRLAASPARPTRLDGVIVAQRLRRRCGHDHHPGGVEDDTGRAGHEPRRGPGYDSPVVSSVNPHRLRLDHVVATLISDTPPRRRLYTGEGASVEPARWSTGAPTGWSHGVRRVRQLRGPDLVDRRHPVDRVNVGRHEGHLPGHDPRDRHALWGGKPLARRSLIVQAQAPGATSWTKVATTPPRPPARMP